QGGDEDLPESHVMSKYLQDKGVDKKRIIIEDESRNTNQNFKFSKEKIEEHSHKSLDEINSAISSYAAGMKIDCSFFASNCEGEIIDKIQEVSTIYDGCIINAGAYTHYSYAIYDAIKSVEKPFIEVHMSNLACREEFRRTSVISSACVGTISGFGMNSYLLAISAMYDLVK
ncbi:MAG: type II 3-dehydroquinate dehydratase, partial [Oscillospiraceae bacterium]